METRSVPALVRAGQGSCGLPLFSAVDARARDQSGGAVAMRKQQGAWSSGNQPSTSEGVLPCERLTPFSFLYEL